MRILLATVLMAMSTLPESSALAQQGGSGDPRPVRTVDAVDLDRYLGDWFEIARYPNRFQRGCAGDVRATYVRRPDGRLDVINRCLEADGRVNEAQGLARVVDERTFAKLKVRFAPAALSFLPFVWGDYWILGLPDDYAWVVVGTPDCRYPLDPGPDPLARRGAPRGRARGRAVERVRCRSPRHDEAVGREGHRIIRPSLIPPSAPVAARRQPASRARAALGSGPYTTPVTTPVAVARHDVASALPCRVLHHAAAGVAGGA